ncbi:hypothetical protein L596_023177 [Steinernema carpocapsae]|uniref:Uncharacterized protein n=1 Tax=Steinernema carpocapsae TaxID=34508 RepID=A0A4U5MCV3_STECR|nr:hypothetical protein L596_023177 [Steinernema carpocapsae]
MKTVFYAWEVSSWETDDLTSQWVKILAITVIVILFLTVTILIFGAIFSFYVQDKFDTEPEQRTAYKKKLQSVGYRVEQAGILQIGFVEYHQHRVRCGWWKRMIDRRF